MILLIQEVICFVYRYGSIGFLSDVIRRVWVLILTCGGCSICMECYLLVFLVVEVTVETLAWWFHC